MRTNIVLDDGLVAEAMKLSRAKTKRELVDRALREFVQRHHQRKLLDLVGKVSIDPDYDYKALREEREPEA